jgi:hypothetical protein
LRCAWGAGGIAVFAVVISALGQEQTLHEARGSISSNQMKIKLLDATEFKATFAEPMRDVLATATNVFDIWPYVAAIPGNELFGNEIVEGCVEHVSATGPRPSTTF